MPMPHFLARPAHFWPNCGIKTAKYGKNGQNYGLFCKISINPEK